MKRIAIVLRNAAGNKFRETILNTLRLSAVDKALLCSGFFQNDHKFNVANDFDLLRFRRCSPLALTPLGIYSYTWAAQFRAFTANLRAINRCRCITVTPKRIPGMAWHAKVFIANCGCDPVVAIVGSSNLTRRAFGAFPQFNKECDVIFWDENHPDVNRAVEDAITVDDAVADVDSGAIVATYDDKHPANRSMSLRKRLLLLEQEILTRAVDV